MNKIVNKLALSAGAAITSLPFVAQAAMAQIETGQDINPGTGFADNIGSLINGVLSFVMVIAALLVFLYLILGGIEWITSGGDKSKTEGARNKITSAVIGLVILAASYAILLIVLKFLGFESLGQVFSEVRTLKGTN
jgi:hypothetical protein